MIPGIFLTGILILYLWYTLRYLIHFNQSDYFTGKLKIFHIIMIWLVPFLWIFLLKSLFKPTPGSHQFPDKKGPDTLSESELGKLMDSSTGE